MTDAELRRIEEELGFGLPALYKTTMLDYPFGGDSGREPMLPDDPEEVINLNSGGLEVEGIDCPLFVGRGGDEAFYFLDAAEPMSAVYRYEGDAGHHEIQAGSWSSYIAQVRRARKQRRQNAAAAGGTAGRWWPF
jgi:hypothetical protein